MGFSRQEHWSGLPCPPPGGIFPTQGLNLGLTLQADSLQSEPPRKPKNSEVDSPLLLQGIFLTPELNWGLLHFRQILYQLSYQGSLQRKLERKWKWKPLSRVPILCNPMDLNSPWNSPGQSTGVGSLSFLQKIFPTQGSNPDLLHCRQLLYQQSYQGSPELSERAKSSLFNI